MFGILASSVIGLMLQGCLCTEWSIQMPENITAIKGSCIVIPCSFSFPDKYNAELNNSTVLWQRGMIGGPMVLKYDKSHATGFEGAILGDFKNRNCTTSFTELPLGFSEPLFFRVEGPIELRYSYDKKLFISFQRDHPPLPVLSFNPPGEVEAGRILTLTCRATVPCPSLPPEVQIGLEKDSSQASAQVNSEQGVMFVVATMSLTVLPTHHGRNVTCEALYPRRYGSKSRGVDSQTLNILYAPHNTRVMMSPASPVPVGRQVILRCLSDANPPVTAYNWYAVSNSGQQVLRATGQEMSFLVTSADKGLYICEAISPQGREKSGVVALEVEDGSEGQQCSVVPYVVCGVLAGLYVLTVVVDVYRYKRLTKTLRTQENAPYATLNLSNISPDYEQIQRNIKSTSESKSKCGDYQNGPSQRRQRPA